MVTPSRVVVVGTSGAGKSTLAGALASKLGVAHVELDALHWEPGWVEAPDDVFLARVEAATAGGAWVVDGNYAVARDLLWRRADTLVWLDYERPVVMARVVWRTLRRAALRETLWNGNRERLLPNLWGPDSVIAWAWTTWARRRREYEALLASDAYGHLRVLRFARPADAARWLAGTAG